MAYWVEVVMGSKTRFESILSNGYELDFLNWEVISGKLVIFRN